MPENSTKTEKSALRSSILAVIVSISALPACVGLDVSRPILIRSDRGHGGIQDDALEEAARCWNEEFGTQIHVDTEGADQVIVVAYADAICTHAGARTDPGMPIRISICYDSMSREYHSVHHTLVHELGHALNIRTHASSHESVMSSMEGGSTYFSGEDRRLFLEANPRFDGEGPCEPSRVDVSNCTCR